VSKTNSARVGKAEILREYGPFAGAEKAGGVTFDGSLAWLAAGTHLQSFDPTTGEPGERLPVAADAGTAFDGRNFFQITGDVIQKVDAKSGKVVGTIPAPGRGRDSGLAWAEGLLWVGQYRDRKIVAIDPSTGEVRRTIESDRFVTGVSWVDGELWHATWEEDASELRRVDPETSQVLERLEMPPGITISGLESDGADSFFCGGGSSGKVRRVRRPARRAS
jgi:outer membrane protein assembly factor BamB